MVGGGGQDPKTRPGTELQRSREAYIFLLFTRRKYRGKFRLYQETRNLHKVLLVYSKLKQCEFVKKKLLWGIAGSCEGLFITNLEIPVDRLEIYG